jgi:hypothetical protein
MSSWLESFNGLLVQCQIVTAQLRIAYNAELWKKNTRSDYLAIGSCTNNSLIIKILVINEK